MGQDIAGACGQLALKESSGTRASAAEDIEDLAGTGTGDGAKAGARARSTSRVGVGATAKLSGGTSRPRAREPARGGKGGRTRGGEPRRRRRRHLDGDGVDDGDESTWRLHGDDGEGTERRRDCRVHRPFSRVGSGN